jgi:uncharacterized membrane protein
MEVTPLLAETEGQPLPTRRRISFGVRNTFIAGLVVLIPIVITVKALWWLFTTVDSLADPLTARVLGRPIPGIGFLVTLAMVFLAGIIFSSGPLRRMLEGLEGLLDDVPLVGTVYGTTKKVLAGFGRGESESSFKRFVLAQLPGRTTPGFLTGQFQLTRRDGTSYRVCTVYVPTNHLYVGDVVVLPEEDVIETDLSIEDGVSLILSAGSSVPDHLREV